MYSYTYSRIVGISRMLRQLDRHTDTYSRIARGPRASKPAHTRTHARSGIRKRMRRRRSLYWNIKCRATISDFDELFSSRVSLATRSAIDAREISAGRDAELEQAGMVGPSVLRTLWGADARTCRASRRRYRLRFNFLARSNERKGPDECTNGMTLDPLSKKKKKKKSINGKWRNWEHFTLLHIISSMLLLLLLLLLVVVVVVVVLLDILFKIFGCKNKPMLTLIVMYLIWNI